PGALQDADNRLLTAAEALLGQIRGDLAEQAFNRVLDAIWAVVSAANRYVDEQAPWALRKTDPERMASVLYVLAETNRHLAILLQPVVPGSAARILDQLGVPVDRRAFADLGAVGRLVPGTRLPTPSGVFPRYIEEQALGTGS